MLSVEHWASIHVPHYSTHELSCFAEQHNERDRQQFLLDLPYRDEIAENIDPLLYTAGSSLYMGNTTGEILWNMKLLQPKVYGHCQSVADLASRIAEEVGTEEPPYEVTLAGALHDIYKIPLRHLTDHSGPFTDAQREQYSEHSTRGAELLHEWGFPRSVVYAAHFHHCGMRYPLERPNDQPVHNSEIPRIAKIVNLADYSVTALTPRSYKPPVPMDELKDRIIQAVAMEKVDLDIADAFLRIYYNEGPYWMNHSITESLVA